MGVLASLICIVIGFRHVPHIVDAAIGAAAHSVATQVTRQARHNEIIESQTISSDTVRAGSAIPHPAAASLRLAKALCTGANRIVSD